MARRDPFEDDDFTRRRHGRRDPFAEDADAPDIVGRDDDLDKDKKGVVRPENGVTLSWLAIAFETTPRTVRSRLVGIKPMYYGDRNTPIYAIKDAVPRLVEPDVDVEQVIKRMNPQHLPPMLQAVFWDGQMKKLAWQEKAGKLWHTDDVFDLMADVFKTLKSSMQLWMDTVHRNSPLTPEQRMYLQRQVDDLQDEMHKKIVALGRQRVTVPVSERPLEGIEDE